MTVSSRYSIRAFIADAKQILADGIALEQKKMAIGERLRLLSQRDDLIRYGAPMGPTDGCTGVYLLWREPPHIGLILAQFDHGYMSPVHEHGNFWVVACGYRGRDRWDMYERLDDGSRPGYADLRLVDQIVIPPGTPAWMREPPRAIHSHNNEFSGETLELIFTGSPPMDPKNRLLYDVEEKRSWPTWFKASKLVGDVYPPPAFKSLLGGGRRLGERFGAGAFCPVCALC